VRSRITFWPEAGPFDDALCLSRQRRHRKLTGLSDGFYRASGFRVSCVLRSRREPPRLSTTTPRRVETSRARRKQISPAEGFFRVRRGTTNLMDDFESCVGPFERVMPPWASFPHVLPLSKTPGLAFVAGTSAPFCRSGFDRALEGSPLLAGPVNSLRAFRERGTGLVAESRPLGRPRP